MLVLVNQPCDSELGSVLVCVEFIASKLDRKHSFLPCPFGLHSHHENTPRQPGEACSPSYLPLVTLGDLWPEEVEARKDGGRVLLYKPG